MHVCLTLPQYLSHRKEEPDPSTPISGIIAFGHVKDISFLYSGSKSTLVPKSSSNSIRRPALYSGLDEWIKRKANHNEILEAIKMIVSIGLVRKFRRVIMLLLYLLTLHFEIVIFVVVFFVKNSSKNIACACLIFTQLTSNYFKSSKDKKGFCF